MKHDVHNLSVSIKVLLRYAYEVSCRAGSEESSSGVQMRPCSASAELWFPRPCRVTRFGNMFEGILAKAASMCKEFALGVTG